MVVLGLLDSCLGIGFIVWKLGLDLGDSICIKCNVSLRYVKYLI